MPYLQLSFKDSGSLPWLSTATARNLPVLCDGDFLGHALEAVGYAWGARALDDLKLVLAEKSALLEQHAQLLLAQATTGAIYFL